MPYPSAVHCQVAVVDQREARQQLNEAIRERETVRAVAERADAYLRDAMRNAIDNGVTIAEVAELTGYHRNSVRRIIEVDDRTR